jgi:hypothetical protein
MENSVSFSMFGEGSMADKEKMIHALLANWKWRHCRYIFIVQRNSIFFTRLPASIQTQQHYYSIQYTKWTLYKTSARNLLALFPLLNFVWQKILTRKMWSRLSMIEQIIMMGILGGSGIRYPRSGTAGCPHSSTIPCVQEHLTYRVSDNEKVGERRRDHPCVY